MPDQTMRERVAVAMFARRDDPYDDREWAELDRADQEFWYCYADAALTALATHDCAVKAEALREAADHWQDSADHNTPADIDPEWLRARANRIEAERG